ncbi:MAG: diguanylate cyclase [Lysobacterales bacterium]
MTYLILSLILCSLMLSLIFLLAWQNFARPLHALTWSLTFLAGAFQYSVNLFSDRLFGDSRFYWVIGTALGVLFVSIALAGFRQWAGKSVRAAVIALTGATVVALVALFTFGHPHTGLRMFIGPAYGGLICLINAQIVLRHDKSRGNISKAAAAVLGVFGTSQILAALAALMQGTSPDAMWLETYRQINFVALPAGYLGTGLFMVLILASDLSAQMSKLARTDSMTGLLNRRGFNEFAGPLLPRARRGKQPLSVIMCDVDHFKNINDQYGHNAGDHALKALAKLLSQDLREGDLFGRLGGEEFVLALPGTDLEQATIAAERLRAMLEQSEIGWRPEPLQLTASFGVSSFRDDDHTIDDVLQRADRALYRAKNDGRNRVGVERPAVAQSE